MFSQIGHTYCMAGFSFLLIMLGDVHFLVNCLLSALGICSRDGNKELEL